MKLKDKAICVIGGAGLIGSHITEKLVDEPIKKVIVFDNFTRGTYKNLDSVLEHPKLDIVEGSIEHTDVLNDVLKDVDGVFHLAAMWLKHCHEYPRAAFDVNIRGTFNVMEACVKQDVKRLVYSSSASVYGDAVETPMTEEHPYNNRTFYGATKISGEHMLRSFNERFGLNYVGLRYMNVYGPRQDYKGTYTAVMMKILDRLDQEKPPIVFGDGSQSYDFIYVEDIARANIQAMKGETTDEFYNVGRGVETTIKELAELILDITDSSLDIEYREDEGETFVTKRVGSTGKARTDLNFEATTELKQGMKQLIEWRNQQPDTRTYPVT
ncbi:MAG: NAD-dependent epimerase/dehydratase family protein [bacterium]